MFRPELPALLQPFPCPDQNWKVNWPEWEVVPFEFALHQFDWAIAQYQAEKRLAEEG